MSSVVVVGGGISGLVACRLLIKKFDQIILIEKEPQLGGLLRSEENKLGHFFDQGTHFILPTKIPELNEIIFEDLPDEDCFLWSESLKEGSFYNGKLSPDSGCIDARTLPQDIYLKGLSELLNAKPNKKASNLEEFLINNYGPVYTKNLYGPLIKKFTDLPARELDPSVITNFLITRLRVLDRFASSQLKKITHYDEKIAWSHRDDGHSNIIKRYPKNGGVGAWSRRFERRLRKDGVRILVNESVTDVQNLKKNVNSVTLSTGEILPCDHVVWTIPPVFFFRASGIEWKGTSPKFRNVVLIHFSIDQEVNTDLHWIVCYDTDFLSFRITLYPNITKKQRQPAPHHLTVEVIIDQFEIDHLKPIIFAELKKMDLIPKKSRVLESSHSVIKPGWPIITKGFKDSAAEAFHLAAKSAHNVTFVGRGKNENSHFSHEILEDLYQAFK